MDDTCQSEKSSQCQKCLKSAIFLKTDRGGCSSGFNYSGSGKIHSAGPICDLSKHFPDQLMVSNTFS